jgi:hypothetical protein
METVRRKPCAQTIGAMATIRAMPDGGYHLPVAQTQRPPDNYPAYRFISAGILRIMRTNESRLPGTPIGKRSAIIYRIRWSQHSVRRQRMRHQMSPSLGMIHQEASLPEHLAPR